MTGPDPEFHPPHQAGETVGEPFPAGSRCQPGRLLESGGQGLAAGDITQPNDRSDCERKIIDTGLAVEGAEEIRVPFVEEVVAVPHRTRVAAKAAQVAGVAMIRLEIAI